MLGPQVLSFHTGRAWIQAAEHIQLPGGHSSSEVSQMLGLEPPGGTYGRGYWLCRP